MGIAGVVFTLAAIGCFHGIAADAVPVRSECVRRMYAGEEVGSHACARPQAEPWPPRLHSRKGCRRGRGAARGKGM